MSHFYRIVAIIPLQINDRINRFAEFCFFTMHRLISSLIVILLLFYSGVSPSMLPALGQETEGESRVIPPPPRQVDPDDPTKLTQAEQDSSDPERAYNPKTGQNLHWDCNKKTWVDSKTGKKVGFEGAKSGGEVIPPPPRQVDPDDPTQLTQAEQDLSNPKRAYNPKTGQNLHWDSKEKTWVDSKTGEKVGLKGAKTKKPCPKPKTVSATIKKVAVVVVVCCLIATAIAVPIAVGVGSHHHHNNNADQQVALFHLLRARDAEPPARVETVP
ncbi:MAG: hypothetical protein IT343_21130 [Candidatus Melainabacteria bacterium]|jgi:hypothetical protein|nr:hypothetical protein [Candidatus Melainabacteria bacterium]